METTILASPHSSRVWELSLEAYTPISRPKASVWPQSKPHWQPAHCHLTVRRFMWKSKSTKALEDTAPGGCCSPRKVWCCWSSSCLHVCAVLPPVFLDGRRCKGVGGTWWPVHVFNLVFFRGLETTLALLCRQQWLTCADQAPTPTRRKLGCFFHRLYLPVGSAFRRRMLRPSSRNASNRHRAATTRTTHESRRLLPTWRRNLVWSPRHWIL